MTIRSGVPLPLSQMQAWMQQAVMGSDAALNAAEINERILPSATLTPSERLAIYQRGYYARLLQCLESQFKALRQALGAELFRDFGAEYLRTYPSNSPTLSDLGARLSQWLSEHRPDRDVEDKEPWIDFMIDLARYEWAVYLFFDKPGHEGRPLATAATPDRDLAVQTTLELHRFTFPVASYYDAVAAGEAEPPIPAAEDTHLVIVRTNYKIGILRLAAPQYEFLTHLVDGQSIPDALRAIASAHDVPVAQVEEAWARWKGPWCAAGLFGIV